MSNYIGGPFGEYEDNDELASYLVDVVNEQNREYVKSLLIEHNYDLSVWINIFKRYENRLTLQQDLQHILSEIHPEDIADAIIGLVYSGQRILNSSKALRDA